MPFYSLPVIDSVVWPHCADHWSFWEELAAQGIDVTEPLCNFNGLAVKNWDNGEDITRVEGGHMVLMQARTTASATANAAVNETPKYDRPLPPQSCARSLVNRPPDSVNTPVVTQLFAGFVADRIDTVGQVTTAK